MFFGIVVDTKTYTIWEFLAVKDGIVPSAEDGDSWHFKDMSAPLHFSPLQHPYNTIVCL